MTKPPIAAAVLLLLLLLAAAAARFTPSDNHLLSCGSTSPTTLDDHRIFLPDSPFLLSPNPSIPLPSPHPSPLSATARVFTRPASYQLPITTPGTHLLRLHFFPFPSPSPSFHLSSDLFHVSAPPFLLLANFTPSAPSLKEFLIPVSSPHLTLSFIPASPSNFAFINAIELVSAPPTLLSSPATPIGSDTANTAITLSNQAMETIHRINVGGPKITPFNDTLWRTWAADNTGNNLVTFSGRIMYREFGASREVAPDSVYSSARVIKGADGSPLIWLLPVDSGYLYLVRMHFCDIASLALNEIYFNVYINGYTASKDFDLSDASGELLASPYYADFVVGADAAGVLNVSISPSKLSVPSRISGLLNGLEVMKINNTVGSLCCEISADLILESPGRMTFGTFVRSLMCGFAFMTLLVVVFLLVVRLRAETRNQVGWSPLRTEAPEMKLGKGNQLLPSQDH